MASRGENICFYSNNCKWSKQFIEELGKTPYFNDFRFICIDPGKYNGRLPDFLKQTPTLVIKGESDPRINDQVMGWLFARRSTDMNSSTKQDPPRRPMPGITQGQVQNHPSGPAPVDGPSAFNVFEIGASRQDNYSFLDDGMQQSMMTRSFEFIDGAPGIPVSGTGQPNASNGPDKRTNKEKSFDTDMESYMKQREMSSPYQPIVRK